MMANEKPLLAHGDFLRLVRSAAITVFSKHRGLPPLLPPVAEMAGQLLADFDLGGYWPEIHRLLSSFLNGKIQPPDGRETGAQYAERLMRHWLHGPREIVFFTSGSTGEAKACPHPETLLQQEAQETARLFQGLQRVLVTVPLLHSYGFIFGLMLPKSLAVPVLDVPPFSTLLTESLRPDDLLVSFPQLLAKLGDIATPNVQFLSSTAPCPEAAFQAILDKGIKRLTEIYGASETGAMAVRFSTGPFRLLNHWRRADDASLARRLPGASEQHYALPDNIHWHDSRCFVPMGRRDRAVQVAGVNVYPARVAAIIQEHPKVKECAVRLMNPGEGFRLKAFIVPHPNLPDHNAKPEINHFLRTRLSPPERPGHLTFGPQLPCSLFGKDADWEI